MHWFVETSFLCLPCFSHYTFRLFFWISKTMYCCIKIFMSSDLFHCHLSHKPPAFFLVQFLTWCIFYSIIINNALAKLATFKIYYQVATLNWWRKEKGKLFVQSKYLSSASREQFQDGCYAFCIDFLIEFIIQWTSVVKAEVFFQLFEVLFFKLD